MKRIFSIFSIASRNHNHNHKQQCIGLTNRLNATWLFLFFKYPFGTKLCFLFSATHLPTTSRLTRNLTTFCSAQEQTARKSKWKNLQCNCMTNKHAHWIQVVKWVKLRSAYYILDSSLLHFDGMQKIYFIWLWWWCIANERTREKKKRGLSGIRCRVNKNKTILFVCTFRYSVVGW